MPETVIVLDKDEAAERLRVSTRTIRRYIAAGLLNGVRVGPRLVKVTEESVDRLLADGLRMGRAALRETRTGGRLAARTITAAMIALALTACASGKPAALTTAPPPTSPSSPAAPSPSPLASAAYVPYGQVLTCTAVVDTDPSMNGLSPSGLRAQGFNPSALTAEQIIGLLEAMTETDGLVNITQGTPTSTDTTILDAADQDLLNYSTSNQLGTDADQFASDEQSYDPDGPVNISYASALLADIRALMGDCPQALKWAAKVTGS
jgi:excisionase family DNA binding protein